MNKSSFKRKEVTWLAVFAIIMIPLLTWLFGTRGSPADYTFTKNGNALGYRVSFIIWGITTGLLLAFYIARLFVLKSFRDTRARKLLVWSLVFLVLTVLIPSLEGLTILSRLHDLMATAFGLALTASLFLFIKHLSATDQKVYGWSMMMFYLVVGGSLALLLLFGMTGIFQMFFFISLSIFLALLNRWLFG